MYDESGLPAARPVLLGEKATKGPKAVCLTNSETREGLRTPNVGLSGLVSRTRNANPYFWAFPFQHHPFGCRVCDCPL